MVSPFDDAKVRAQMSGWGVVHKPGMADAMLSELAPLLAADGIDLDNLDATDLDAVNAALARATERHNFELFTPVGVQREGAVLVLRSFSSALADGDEGAARAVLAAVEPAPEDDAPAISHVIGVSLGALDTWHSDPARRAALASTDIPRWEKRSRAAATDILSLARKGRAFDSIGSLHRRHSGLAIFEGAALVIAAWAAALASPEGGSVRDLVGGLLADGNSRTADAPDGVPQAGGVGTGAAIGPNAGRSAQPISNSGKSFGRTPSSLADRPVAREFGRWLRQSADQTAAEASEQQRELEALFEFARSLDIDVHQPDGAEDLADTLFEILTDPENDDLPESVIDTLHDYVHFRIDTADNPDAWEDAHEAVEEVVSELSSVPEAIGLAIDAAEQIDPEVRRAALAGTRIVAAVDDLLEWLGSGRQAAPSGALRRADIQQVAGMLGISAVGVSKRPPFQPAFDSLSDLDSPLPMPDTIHALSMKDVPPLAAWWQALAVTGLIEPRPSRVRPGDEAVRWASSRMPPDELAEMLVGVFVAEVLMQTRPSMMAPLEEQVTAEAIGQLLGALAPELTEGIAPGERASLLTPRALLTLHHLEFAGLLDKDGTGALVVPTALRGVVARGVLLALTLLAAHEAD
ncbi:hypothetical protein [Salinibacterium sp. ZJ454]|uniref:hypothetical protein n=1 Tax=Salinibacterium sp. ZJ454 TaxID=2708339 RepID=UPI0014206F6C|nr:hypothetical protein [Salinibacterium sp. ZJ454]